jgi:hypothetical protein
MTEGFRLHRSAAIRHRPRVNQLPAPVITIQVDIDCWRTALGLADNDPRRLRVISETEIVVLNNPPEGRYR